MEDKTYSELQARLEEAWKEIAYYKRLSKEAGDLRLHETEELSRLIAKFKKAEKELEQAKDELEQRVEERTADLSKVNLALTREISERKQVEAALWESRQQFQGLVETLYDLIWEVSPEGHYTYISPRVKDILGYEPEDIIGKTPFDLMPTEEGQRVSEIFAALTAKQKPIIALENINLHKDGHPVIMETSALPFYDSKGNFKGYRGTDRNITQRKRTEEELRRNQDVTERLAQEIAIIAEIGKVIGSSLDTQEVYESFAVELRKLIPFDRLAVNLHSPCDENVRVAYVFGEAISGREKGTLFLQKGSVSDVLARTKAGLYSYRASDQEMDQRFDNYAATVNEGLRSLMGVPLIYRDEVIGTLHFRSKTPNAYGEQNLRMAEKVGAQIAGAIGGAKLFSDLKRTEQELKDSEKRYRELSIVDDLTQLYNSRHFYSQLKIELDRLNRYEQPLTLLLLDLDNFKAFNDSYGHVEGDQVLMRLGQVVKRCLRETDFAYRYGGEEFTIVLPMTRSVDGAVTAERIRAEFKKELFTPVPGKEVHMTVSIGLAQYNPQEDMKAFVHRVDQLMYQGKKNGKDRVCCEP